MRLDTIVGFITGEPFNQNSLQVEGLARQEAWELCKMTGVIVKNKSSDNQRDTCPKNKTFLEVVRIYQ